MRMLFPPPALTLALMLGCGGDSPGTYEGAEGQKVPEVDKSTQLVALPPYTLGPEYYAGIESEHYQGAISIWVSKDNQKQPYTGTAITRFPNGRLRTRESLQVGLLHGMARGWHENGQKQYETSWTFGVPDGLEVQWHENGELRWAVLWDRGVVINKKGWTAEGAALDLSEEGWGPDGSRIAKPD